MLEKLKQILEDLDDAMYYSVALDHAYTRHYLSLVRKRRAIKRAIRVFEKEDRRLKKYGEI